MEKQLTQETLLCQIPPTLGEIVTFAPPILESRWLAWSPTPCPQGEADDMRITCSYIIIMHSLLQKTIIYHSLSSKDNYLATYLLKYKSKSCVKGTNSQKFYAKISTANIDA